MGDSPNNAQIDYITIATTGNGADFGDLTVGRGFGPGASSGIRGLFAGGNGPSNVIDYVTIASTGNATDFGDLTVGRYANEEFGAGDSDYLPNRQQINNRDWTYMNLYEIPPMKFTSSEISKLPFLDSARAFLKYIAQIFSSLDDQ